jgi:acetyl esterase/lipase
VQIETTPGSWPSRSSSTRCWTTARPHDRTTDPDPTLLPFATWNYDNNHTGWHALLGDAVGGPDVPGHAAPSRARDLSGLPPAYIEVGELDIFRDEDIAYARRLAATGTSVELHVHPRLPALLRPPGPAHRRRPTRPG